MVYQKIGVDLGNRALKISVLEKIDDFIDEYKIKDAQSYIVDEDLDLKGYFKFVESAIKDFLKFNNIKQVEINFTTPCDNDNVIVNCFKVPMLEESMLEKTILFEVESSISINPKDYSHKFKILDEFEEEGEVLVLSNLIKNEYIEHILKLRKFRWKINQLETQFYIGNKILKDNTTLIDFGFNNTRIYLYKEGHIADTYLIPMGSFDFLDRISEIFKTSLNQSEEVLLNSYVNTPSNLDDLEDLRFNPDEELENLIEELTTIASNIIEELKRNIRVMELNNNIIIENVYYSGELTKLKNFIDLTSSELDINMEPLNFLTLTGFNLDDYLDSIPDEIKNKDIESLEDKHELEDLIYEVNKVEPFIYSALSNVKNDSKFNFLRDIKFYIDKTALIVGLLSATIFSQISFGLIGKQYNNKIYMASNYLSEIQENNSSLESEIMDLNNNMDRNRTIINRIENLKDKKKWLSDILYILPEGTPTNTGITDVSIEAGHAILKGYSEDYSSVGYLAMALEEYGEVTITEVGEKSDTADHRVEGNIKMYKQFIMEIKYDHRLIDDGNESIGESLENQEEIPNE